MLRTAVTLLVLMGLVSSASAQGVVVEGQPILQVELSNLSKSLFKKYLEYVGSANDYAKALKTADDTKDMTKLKVQLEQLEKSHIEQRKLFLVAMVDDGLPDKVIAAVLNGTFDSTQMEIVQAYFVICRAQPKFAKQFQESKMFMFIEGGFDIHLSTKCLSISPAIKAYSLKNSGNEPKSLNDIVDFLEQGKEAIIDPWGQTYQFKFEEVEEEGRKRERLFIWTKNPHSEKLYGMIPPSLLKKTKK